MKNLITILITTFLTIQFIHAQEPGFHIEPDHNVLFGDSMTDAGTKFMWIPSKGALRAGNVNGTQWNIDAIGEFSTAFGINNKASGLRAMAWGFGNTASGFYATAWGRDNIAQSRSETVLGEYADTIMMADNNSWVATDQLFVVGNGTADNARSNALTILKNGETTISDKLGIGTAIDPFFNFRLTIKESGNTLIGYRDAADNTQWHTRLVGDTLSWSETGQAYNRFVLLPGGKIGLNTATIDTDAVLQYASGAKLTTTGIWTDVSDISKKENISNLYYGLTEVLALNPVQYDYKINKEASFGFIAQELEKILPELVFGEDGNKSVGYGQITAVLTKAMQEQQEIIKSIQLENDQLKDKNSALESRLEKLESLIEAHFSSDK